MGSREGVAVLESTRLGSSSVVDRARALYLFFISALARLLGYLLSELH